MTNKLNRYLQRRKAQHYFVKINDMKNIGKKAHLQIEAHASLGNLQVQPGSNPINRALLACQWWQKPLVLLQTLQPENPELFAQTAAQLTDITQYPVIEIQGRSIRPVPHHFLQFAEDNINPNDAVNNQPSPSLTLDS